MLRDGEIAVLFRKTWRDGSRASVAPVWARQVAGRRRTRSTLGMLQTPKSEATSLRILVLCYELPPVGGGGGRIALDVARGLLGRGHSVRVLTSHVAGLAREETIEGVSVRRAFAARRRADRCSVPEMAGYVAMHIAPALHEIGTFKPDVVHVHFAVPTGAVAWAATRLTLGAVSFDGTSGRRAWRRSRTDRAAFQICQTVHSADLAIGRGGDGSIRIRGPMRRECVRNDAGCHPERHTHARNHQAKTIRH